MGPVNVLPRIKEHQRGLLPLIAAHPGTVGVLILALKDLERTAIATMHNHGVHNGRMIVLQGEVSASAAVHLHRGVTVVARATPAGYIDLLP